jgi:uncharacterized protein YkwD
MQKVFMIVCLMTLPLSTYAGREHRCYDMDQEACSAFHRTNVERRKHRLPELEYMERCFDMARDQSEDMVRRGYFDHDRPATRFGPGESFSRRAARFGLSAGVAENIAKTSSGEEAVERWMKSPGHRRNILNRNYHYVAVAHEDGFYTQVFAK